VLRELIEVNFKEVAFNIPIRQLLLHGVPCVIVVVVVPSATRLDVDISFFAFVSCYCLAVLGVLLHLKLVLLFVPVCLITSSVPLHNLYHRLDSSILFIGLWMFDSF